MILLLPLSALLALVAWNVTRWPAVRTRNDAPDTVVSVLIPARDEEQNLASCLDTVLTQAGVLEILVYNDHSTDATREIAESYPGVRLATTQPLPRGWSGKTFACSCLASEARGEWLLFLDADARLEPGAIAGMLAEARTRRATFLSCWPGLLMYSLQERLLMPMLNFVVFSAYPAPLGLMRKDPSLGIAHGACILAERRTYEAVGGHAAVASEIFEDTQLARLWRERGENSLCLDGQHVVRVRMYENVQQIWSGFQKNLRSAFRSPVSFWAFLTFHFVLFLFPFLIGSPAALLVIVARLLLALRFRQPLWSALVHPFAECFLIALGVSSWWRWNHGSGVVWKGRVYRGT